VEQYLASTRTIHPTTEQMSTCLLFVFSRRYRKFSERLRRVVDGYPKKMAPAWYGALCGGTARAPRLQVQ